MTAHMVIVVILEDGLETQHNCLWGRSRLLASGRGSPISWLCDQGKSLIFS